MNGSSEPWCVNMCEPNFSHVPFWYSSCNHRILGNKFATYREKKKLPCLSEAADLKVFHETLHFTKWKCPLFTGWIIILTASQGLYQLKCGFFFFLKIKPASAALTGTGIGNFILSSLPGEFLLTYSRFFRSEQWAFKNRGLKFGEKESCASCGEEKHFGSWRWIKVSQQGAAADPIPLMIPELFCGGHSLQLRLSHCCT